MMSSKLLLHVDAHEHVRYDSPLRLPLLSPTPPRLSHSVHDLIHLITVSCHTTLFCGFRQ